MKIADSPKKPAKHINDIFSPEHTMKEFVEIALDKNSALIFDGFTKYIKNDDNLTSVKMLNIRVEPVSAVYGGNIDE